MQQVNAAGNDGLLFGNPGLVWTQFVAVAATYVFAAIGTFVILKLLALVMPLRVKQHIEMEGLDVPEHGEEAYGQEFEFTSGLSTKPLAEGSKSP